MWKVPNNLDFLVTTDASNSSADLCYTSKVEQLSRARIAAASLNISAPFVGAAAEAKREENTAENSTHKTLRMVGRWNYPRAKLRLKHCTVVSPSFVDAIKKTLAQGSEQAQFDALSDVFRQYGHAVPEEVLLGGQMFFSTRREVTGHIEAESVRTAVKAAVSIQTSDGSGGGGGAGFDDGSGSKLTAQQIRQSVKWQCVGGDTTLSDDPGKWRETVKNPDLWSVIERRGLAPLTDWLEETLKEQVNSVWNAGLRKLWGGCNRPDGYVFPEFKGKPFTISYGTGGAAAVLSGKRLERHKDKHGPWA